MAFVFRLLSRPKRLQLCSVQAVLRQKRTICFHLFAKEVLFQSMRPSLSKLHQIAKCIDIDRKCYSCRSSTIPQTCNDINTEVDFISFFKFAFSAFEGSNHIWLNCNMSNNQLFNTNGIFLVIFGAFFENSMLCSHQNQDAMLESVKQLKRRYPKLQIFGFQHCDFKSMPSQNDLAKTILKEYVTFPVLLADKEFCEIKNKACYLLLDISKNLLLRYELDVDINSICKTGIEEFQLVPVSVSSTARDSESYLSWQSEVTVGPQICSSMRNLLLYYPSCISTDEYGSRIFLSDTNHHRIIVADVDGRIIDCIGSSPGFVDGDFESAELLRPAGSVYHVDEDCLYFVDSENNAIRRADMERRVVETVWPVGRSQPDGIWSWVVGKLGIGKKNYKELTDIDQNSLAFPWHLLQIDENDLLVLNRSLQTSCILSVRTGELKETITGFPNIMEAYRDIILAKTNPLKEIFENKLAQKFMSSFGHSFEGLPFADLLSAATMCKDTALFCDTVGQTVLKCDQTSGNVASMQFSNLHVLGFPYWFIYPAEPVLSRNDAFRCNTEDCLQQFKVPPGRCKIRVNVDTPKGTKLAAPLLEECILRRARGAAAEITGTELIELVEKVGVAQQWYDELDNLTISKPEMESGAQDEGVCQKSSSQVGNVIECAVDTSPGTGEVIISAVIYLKVDNAHSLSVNPEVRDVMSRLLQSCTRRGYDAVISLIESNSVLESVVFMKPLHLRIKLDCDDHPTCPRSKDIISTETTLDVNVSL